MVISIFFNLIINLLGRVANSVLIVKCLGNQLFMQDMLIQFIYLKMNNAVAEGFRYYCW